MAMEEMCQTVLGDVARHGAGRRGHVPHGVGGYYPVVVVGGGGRVFISTRNNKPRCAQTHFQLPPQCVARLLARYETLKTVHGQEKRLQKRLQGLEDLQSDVSRKLDVCRISLDALSESVEQNLGVMARNLELVEG